MLRNTAIKRVLILSPHTDDGEFGCGGSIARYIEDGAIVYYVAFSSCEESIPDNLPQDTLKIEVQNATSKLGIKKENLIIYNYPVRKFPEFRQSILEDMVRINKDIQPDIVYLPSTTDTHQDHNIISREGFRAYKKTTILGYEMPWNNLTFTSSAFVKLKDTHLSDKIEALNCYQSQTGRSYANENFIRSLAITRGTQIGCSYAEAFEAIRWIINLF